MKSKPQTKQIVKSTDNHRPSNWKTAKRWRDDSLYFHPVDPNTPDKSLVHGRPPDWVFERRGQEPPPAEAKQPTEEILAKGFNCTDLGNAERQVANYGSIMHYCPDYKYWLVWDGQRWDRDMGAKIATLAKNTVRKIYHEAGDELDDKKRKELTEHGKRSEGDSRISAMIHLAESEFKVPIRPDALDSDPWLLNCNNGTINLKDGTLLPHDRNDLITKLVDIDFDPTAECPMWDKFLEDTTGGNTELIDYLQLVFGVCLTGDMLDQVFFYLFGLGQNGKSTYCDKLLEITGDYGYRVNSEMFMVSQKGGGASESVANLRGKRVIVSSEVPEGRKLNIGLLKDLSGGGELMNARRLYSHEEQFKPECKILMFGNNKPTVMEGSKAVWRRLKLIHFKNTVADTDKDIYLGQKLKEELPGILAWAVRGCLIWQQVRFLKEPEVITAATKAYQSDEDILGDFLTDECELGGKLSVGQSPLKKAYIDWCCSDENAVKPLGAKAFARRLEEKSCYKKTIKNIRSWMGINLKVKALR